uniref:RanBP2-type domain-containing protein n=1 Tax=Ditylenchus dipsaci TaxID=166011 RepID=A0A915CPU3_9BILA
MKKKKKMRKTNTYSRLAKPLDKTLREDPHTLLVLELVKKLEEKSAARISKSTVAAVAINRYGQSLNYQKEQEKEKEEEFEPDSWECSVCTYRNQFAAFKCEICDTRKGTSTRKPRLNPSVVQQQTLVQTMAVQQTLAGQQIALKRQASRNSPESSASMPTTSTTTVPAEDPVKLAAQNRLNARLLKRKPVQFRDVLVVRSAAKKKQVTANGV